MITSSEIHRKAKNIHQNGRINEFYEDHEHIDRFDEYILSMKQYKPRKVVKIGQNHKKCQNYQKSALIFLSHAEKWVYIHKLCTKMTVLMYSMCLSSIQIHLFHIFCVGGVHMLKKYKKHIKIGPKIPIFPIFVFLIQIQSPQPSQTTQEGN